MIQLIQIDSSVDVPLTGFVWIYASSSDRKCIAVISIEEVDRCGFSRGGNASVLTLSKSEFDIEQGLTSL